MTDKEKSAASPSHDRSAELIQEFASEPPVKDLETIKAASDALERDDGRENERRERVDARARQLWEQAGKRGTVDAYRADAEAALADEG